MFRMRTTGTAYAMMFFLPACGLHKFYLQKPLFGAAYWINNCIMSYTLTQAIRHGTLEWQLPAIASWLGWFMAFCWDAFSLRQQVFEANAQLAWQDHAIRTWLANAVATQAPAEAQTALPRSRSAATGPGDLSELIRQTAVPARR